jgi:hypothetical protein
MAEFRAELFGEFEKTNKIQEEKYQEILKKIDVNDQQLINTIHNQERLLKEVYNYIKICNVVSMSMIGAIIGFIIAFIFK